MRTKTLVFAAALAVVLPLLSDCSSIRSGMDGIQAQVDTLILGHDPTLAERKEVNDKVAYFERHCESVHPNTDLELCVSRDLKESRNQFGGPTAIVIPHID